MLARLSRPFVLYLTLLFLWSPAAQAQRTPAPGSPQDFTLNDTSALKLRRIDDTHVLAVYKAGTSDLETDMEARIGQVDVANQTIAWGAPTTIETAPFSSQFTVEFKMDEQQALVAYVVDEATDRVAVRLFAFSTATDTIGTVGAALKFDTVPIDSAVAHAPALIKISNLAFLLVHVDEAGDGLVRYLMHSDGTPTITGVFNSVSFVAGESPRNLQALFLSLTKNVHAVTWTNASGEGRIIPIRLDKTAIFPGTPSTVSGAASQLAFATFPSFADTLHITTVHVEDDANEHAYARVANLDIPDLIFSDTVYPVEQSTAVQGLITANIEADEFLMAYNSGPEGPSTVQTGRISGTVGNASIAFSAQTLVAAQATNITATRLSGDSFLIAYEDAANLTAPTQVIIGVLVDAPTLAGVPNAITVTEDTASALDLSGVTVADVDGDPVSLTLAVSTGTLASTDGNGTIAGVTISGSGSNSMTLAGTIASINTYLDNTSRITFTTAANDTRAVTLTLTPNDGSEDGGFKNVTLNVTAINDPPTLTATGATADYVEGAAGLDLFSAVTVSTVEVGQTIAGLTLTVSSVSDGADEKLTIDGSTIALTDANTGSTAGNSLQFNVSVASNTASVTLSGGTLITTAAQNIIDSMSYRNTSDTLTEASRVVTLTSVTDDGASDSNNDNSTTLSISATVTVVAVNDPPVYAGIDGDSQDIVAAAGFTNVSAFDDATLTNSDSTDYDGGTLILAQQSGTTNGSWGVDGVSATAGGDALIAAGEVIAVGATDIGTVHATNDGQAGNTLEIALNANATSANIQTLLRSLTFSAPNTPGARTFTLTTSDGDGTANGGDADGAASFTLDVTPSAPVIANLNGDSGSIVSAGTVALDQGGNAAVTDADNTNFDGGNLTIARTTALSGNFTLTGNAGTGASAGAAAGTADGSIAAGESIFIDGVAIGTVTADGQGVNDLVITFNASATPATVTTLIRALRFALTSVSTHTFDVTMTDAGALAGTSLVSGVTLTASAPAPGPQAPGSGGSTETVINGRIGPFTELRNVVIGAQAVLDPSVKPGEGVTFMSKNTIPAGMDLSGMLDPQPFEFQEHLQCVDLNTSIWENDSGSLLDSIRDLDVIAQAGLRLEQDSLTCELKVTADDYRMNLLPSTVFQAESSAQPGVMINDGVIEVINEDRQKFALYPLILDAETLDSGLRKLNLVFSMTDTAIYALNEMGVENPAVRFVGRPAPFSLVTSGDQPAGVYLRELEMPAGVGTAYLIVEASDGMLLRQEIHPAPDDWPALREALDKIPGLEFIQLAETGTITAIVNGTYVRAVPGARVINSGAAMHDDVLLEPQGDVNGDGAADFLIRYSNGNSQMLYILP